MKRLRRCIRWTAMLLILVLLMGWLTCDLWRPAMGRYLVVGQPLQESVDYVYVLGGGIETRPYVAAEVYRKGFCDELLLPGTADLGKTATPLGFNYDLLTRDILLLREVDAERITFVGKSANSTRDEAVALVKFFAGLQRMRESDEVTIAIVTNDFHTRRTKLIFEEIRNSSSAGNLNFRYIAAPTDGFGPENWWKHEVGCRTYLLEYLKLLYTIVV